MATLWITEFDRLPMDASGKALAVFPEPAIRTQKVTFTTTAQSEPFNGRTTYVRILADANCHLRFGVDPTATTDDEPFRADVEYGRAVKAGEGQKIGVAAGS